MIPEEPEENENTQTQNEGARFFVELLDAILSASTEAEEETGETMEPEETQYNVCVYAQGAGGVTRVGPYEKWEAVEMLDCLQKQYNTPGMNILRAGDNLIPMKHITRIYLEEVEEVGDDSW